MMEGTYVRVLLDLLERGVVELAGVPVEVLADAVGLLNTDGVALAQAALVHIAHPRQVGVDGLGRDTLLERDDVLARDDLRDGATGGSGSGGREGGGQKSPDEDREAAKVGHGCYDTISRVFRGGLSMGGELGALVFPMILRENFITKGRAHLLFI